MKKRFQKGSCLIELLHFKRKCINYGNNIKILFLVIIITIGTIQAHGQPIGTVYLCAPMPENCAKTYLSIPSATLCAGSTYTFTPTDTLPVEDSSTVIGAATNSVVPSAARFTLTGYSWAPAGISPSSGIINPATIVYSVNAPAAVCGNATYSLTISSIGPNILNRGDFFGYGSTTIYPCMASLYQNGTGTYGADNDHIKWGNNLDMPPWDASSCPSVYSETFDYGDPSNEDQSLQVNVAAIAPINIAQYFWGEEVNLCSGASYLMTYWVRCDARETMPPWIYTWLGPSGGIWESNGDITGGASQIYLDSTAGNNSAVCDPSWHEVSYIFKSSFGGTSFMGLVCTNYAHSLFQIDGITLQRLDTVTKTVTVSSVCTPTPKITCAPNACFGAPFTFTVTGTPTDVVSYNITRPGAGTITSSGTIGGGGTLNITVPSLTATGTVCLNITGVSVPSWSGLCAFTVDSSKCVAVDSLPKGGVITGSSAECSANPNFTIYDSTTTGATGYTWSYGGSGGTIVGSGDSATFHITSTGTLTVTCTPTNACGSETIAHVFTVYASPTKPTITGSPSICATYTGTFTGTTETGFTGSWSSDAPSIFTVGATSGIVTGISSGTGHLIYTLTGPSPSFCAISDTIPITILATPSMPVVSGTSGICPGITATITATAAYSGSATETFTWTPTASPCPTCNYDVITTTTTATFYSVTATAGGCVSPVKAFTVTLSPKPTTPTVAGTFSVCPGTPTSITASSTAGTVTPTYTWGPSGPTLSCTLCNPATITPSVSGTNSYFVYATALGCQSLTDTFKITGLPSPTVTAISAPSVCPTFAAVLTATVTGGTSYSWSGTGVSSTSLTVTFTPTISATYTFTATNATDGCTTKDTTRVTILPVPSKPVFNAPSYSICVGDSASLFAASTDADSPVVISYTWSPSATLSCSTCESTEAHPTTTTYYTAYATALGCIGPIGVDTVTVKPTPTILSSGEDTAVCAGTAVTFSLTASVSGASSYAWSGPGGYSSTALSPSSPVTITPSVTAYYTLVATGSDGCSAVSTVTVTAHSLPIVPAITGLDTVCYGSVTHYSDLTTGGVWSSANALIASVDASGNVTGVASGGTRVSYTVTNSFGCTTTVYDTIIVLPALNAGIITGGDSVCHQTFLSLFDSVSGGVWTSSNTSIATVGATGNVFGITVGTTVISYTISSGYCPSASASETVKVVTVPLLGTILGIDTVCILNTIILSDSFLDGTWFSYNTGIADVNPTTGVVTGVAVGKAVIAYDATNLCGTSEERDTIYVTNGRTPIYGYTGLCTGNSTSLGNTTSGGTWSSSNASVASINPTTGILTGISTGTVTITYTAVGTCGAFTVTARAAVNEPLYITTRSMLACESLTGSDVTNTLPYIISDSISCIMVCDSSVIRYYANNNEDSMLTWAVTGGTIVHNYGDSIDVLWPGAGITGSITLTDSTDICSGVASVCIQVIQKPVASFSTFSSYACLSDPVAFINYSTADSLSPIVSYYWNFGDGGHSSEISPSHTFTLAATDTVMLVVKNACGCSDTFKLGITVVNSAGTTISCSTIVCDSQSASYTVPAGGCYTWTTIGGAITGTYSSFDSIRVLWDSVLSSGFGYVSVVNSCSGCPGATSIQVPIILANAPITGPDVICVGQQYEYSFPLWPAMQYMWGVPGDSSAIVGYHNDYKTVVDFTTPGTYSIHGWYQNTIALCGGNVSKSITVEPAVSITGPTSICSGTGGTYNIGGGSAYWTLSNVSTGSVVSTSTGASFTYSFPTSGTYMLSATGSFCADPLTITINYLPPVDSVKGPDSVCLGRVYNYTAYHDEPGTQFTWTATGGSIVAPSTGPTVSVIWTGGTMQLQVGRESTTAPYCGSTITTVNIVKDVVALSIAGDTLPCANSHRTYTTSYNRGEVYDWTVVPIAAGSVVSGDHTTGINVLWNNTTVPVTAYVVLKVTKCDNTYNDTLQVHVQSTATVTVTANVDSVCGGSNVTFYAPPGGASYTWNFGDGSPLKTTSTDSVNEVFGYNPTTAGIVHTVTVTMLANPLASCPVAGTGTVVEKVRISPSVSIYSSNTHLCGGVYTEILSTESGYEPVSSSNWYLVGTVTSLGTGSTLDIGQGTYYMAVTGSNGCIAISNNLIIDTNCAANEEDTPCNHSYASGISASTSIVCSTATLQGTYPTPPAVGTWTTGTGVLLSGSHTGSFWESVTSVPGPGTSTFYYMVAYPTVRCKVIDTVTVTVGALPKINATLACGGNVTFTDATIFDPGATLISTTWSGAFTGPGGAGSSVGGVLTAGPYTETESITYTDGTTQTCTVSKSISVPLSIAVSAAFTASASDVCSAIPITFTPVSTAGIASFYWTFGDGSSSILDTTQRTYTWNSGAGNPNFYTVILKVTDSLGCAIADTLYDTVQENLINGDFGLFPASICSNNAPITLTYHNTGALTVSSYLWSTGATTSSISVDTSGSYWVTAFGQYQCQKTVTLPVANIRVIKTPSGPIYGALNYCVGTATALLTGNPSPLVTNKWYFSGYDYGVASSINVGGLSAGLSVPVILIMSMEDTASGITCADTVNDSVHIHALPSTPVITGPNIVDCSTYHLNLTATDAGTGIFNWSDGNSGSVDNIYSGGAYQVTFTDLNGCRDTASVIVPEDPNKYLAYFPSGCYSICSQQLPLSLYGPPDESFHPWTWYMNGSPLSSAVGVMTTSNPLNITASGTYNLGLGNGLCSAESPAMNVSLVNCNNCAGNMTATLTCTSGNEASYSLKVVLNSSTPGTTFVLGTSIGPVVPFSGTLLTPGPDTLTLTFTTLAVPPPSNLEVEVHYTLPNGSQCFQEVKISVPSCTWGSERLAGNDTNTSMSVSTLQQIASALLVYPNPTTGLVTMCYNYGSDGSNGRSIEIYDETGRRVESNMPTDVQGNWQVNTSRWVPGVYIIRMVGDGKVLQTQRLVVIN